MFVKIVNVEQYLVEESDEHGYSLCKPQLTNQIFECDSCKYYINGIEYCNERPEDCYIKYEAKIRFGENIGYHIHNDCGLLNGIIPMQWEYIILEMTKDNITTKHIFVNSKLYVMNDNGKTIDSLTPEIVPYKLDIDYLNETYPITSDNNPSALPNTKASLYTLCD